MASVEDCESHDSRKREDGTPALLLTTAMMSVSRVRVKFVVRRILRGYEHQFVYIAVIKMDSTANAAVPQVSVWHGLSLTGIETPVNICAV